jgi:hypothetical protein
MGDDEKRIEREKVFELAEAMVEHDSRGRIVAEAARRASRAEHAKLSFCDFFLGTIG